MSFGRREQAIYSVVTLGCLAATVYNAFRVNHFFFQSMVYLWSSKVSPAALAWAVFCVFLFFLAF